MPKRYLDKINNKGQYTEYPGITVIANPSKNEDAFWEKIHTVLSNSNLVVGHFTPLPRTSYHMTTLNLFTEMDDGGNNWGQFISDKLPALRELASLLNENRSHLHVKLKSIRSSGVIQLHVEIPQEQRELIEDVAEKFKLKHKIPKEMHITLAYQFKLLSGAHDEKLKQYLQEEIQHAFDECPILTFQAPELAYFKSMEKFTPWNAKTNPFIAKHFNFFSCFSAQNNEPRELSTKMDLN